MSRQVWTNFIDELAHQLYTELNGENYKKREQNIERIFTDVEEYFHFFGLSCPEEILPPIEPFQTDFTKGLML